MSGPGRGPAPRKSDASSARAGAAPASATSPAATHPIRTPRMTRRRTIARVRPMGRHIEISDTRLHVVERGGDGFPLLVFHGGPSLDHHMFGDYLDPLADELRLVLVDQRSQGLSD